MVRSQPYIFPQPNCLYRCIFVATGAVEKPSIFYGFTRLEVYTEEYNRTGFQGVLQAYRVLSDPALNAELRLFSGKTIDVPSLFIGGKSDWGTYSAPGALDLMKTKATTRMGEIELIDGTGHWIQQEQPFRLCELLLAFLKESSEI